MFIKSPPEALEILLLTSLNLLVEFPPSSLPDSRFAFLSKLANATEKNKPFSSRYFHYTFWKSFAFYCHIKFWLCRSSGRTKCVDRVMGIMFLKTKKLSPVIFQNFAGCINDSSKAQRGSSLAAIYLRNGVTRNLHVGRLLLHNKGWEYYVAWKELYYILIIKFELRKSFQKKPKSEEPGEQKSWNRKLRLRAAGSQPLNWKREPQRSK